MIQICHLVLADRFSWLPLLGSFLSRLLQLLTPMGHVTLPKAGRKLGFPAIAWVVDGQFVGRFVDEAYHHCCYPVMVALVEPLQFCLPCEMYGISGAARLSAWSGAILHLWGLSAWLVWPPLMLVGLAALSFRLAALGTGLSSSVLLVLLVLQACLALSQSSTYAGIGSAFYGIVASVLLCVMAITG
ncbi:hypothetical protein D5086_027205 [Populus alba]|uniref:Uncharacterized protein n=1 Tax=Populus alba TaxID=43335 RepID=A0ACC4B4J4_POPAL